MTLERLSISSLLTLSTFKLEKSYSFSAALNSNSPNILDNNNEGQFVFSVSVLIEKGIIQSEKSKGKLAFRVYPPWVKDLNKTAEVEMHWHLNFF
ncbi:MepB family protein [Macrococcoides goetzii]|uniref:MepB family protein n=1 Tax=Macrococcus sp. PK TaxID=2801919 RepID=UPI001F0F10C9|nr:MepB family protein [Macrococcus sp. PK]MCH4985788.1 MepB family protein [Macrococcus sp. PK]